MTQLENTQLGKATTYADRYDASLLFPIPRLKHREEIGISGIPPFNGVDIWYGYELSWLNSKGKPLIGLLAVTFSFDSHSIVESKSFKLYLNSLNQTHFESKDEVLKTIQSDLSQLVGKPVFVQFLDTLPTQEFSGKSIDDLDIEVDTYTVDPSLLTCGSEIVEETLYSHLLKSNCLVTGQPDWGSVWINYRGPRIDHASLLKYIIAFRQHNEFHEQCIERIFMDLLRNCQCKKLTVFGKYTRRGGLDINPFRSNFEKPFPHFKTSRQ